MRMINIELKKYFDLVENLLLEDLEIKVNYKKYNSKYKKLLCKFTKENIREFNYLSIIFFLLKTYEPQFILAELEHYTDKEFYEKVIDSLMKLKKIFMPKENNNIQTAVLRLFTEKYSNENINSTKESTFQLSIEILENLFISIGRSFEMKFNELIKKDYFNDKKI